jgi:hypothetical protein
VGRNPTLDTTVDTAAFRLSGTMICKEDTSWENVGFDSGGPTPNDSSESKYVHSLLETTIGFRSIVVIRRPLCFVSALSHCGLAGYYEAFYPLILRLREPLVLLLFYYTISYRYLYTVFMVVVFELVLHFVSPEFLLLEVSIIPHSAVIVHR